MLKTKKLDMDEPAKILSLALQPPSRIDVEKAVTNLKEVRVCVYHHCNPRSLSRSLQP